MTKHDRGLTQRATPDVVDPPWRGADASHRGASATVAVAPSVVKSSDITVSSPPAVLFYVCLGYTRGDVDRLVIDDATFEYVRMHKYIAPST